MDFILTYDIGTTGVKCTLFDSNCGIAGSETIAYDTLYPRPGWSEQRPEDFWEGVVRGTKALLGRYPAEMDSVAVIGLSGHMNGLIPVDGEGRALYNDIIHSDCRSGLECDELLKQIDAVEFYRITGNRLDPHYTLPKILWLKKICPEAYNKAEFLVGSKDFIRFKLTGVQGNTDYSDASLTCLLDINRGVWAEEIIRAASINCSKLPSLRKSADIGGFLTKEAAAVLGIRAGIPVSVGGGDGACATRGSGVIRKGDAYNYIGSSSWICLLHEKPLLDAKARNFNFYDLDGENYNVCGTVQCATVSYDWVLENIGKYEAEQAKLSGLNVFDRMDEIAAGVPAGSNGVFFLPYLMGERTPYWDKNTRGAFIGFTLFNQRSDLIRATYEGIAFALRSVLEVFEDNRLDAGRLFLIGGGAKSRLWNEIMCNIYRKPVRIHAFPGEATSLGAAMAAGMGTGMFKSWEEAGTAVKYERMLQPEKSLSEKYDRLYEVYRMMYPQMKPVYDRMAGLFAERDL